MGKDGNAKGLSPRENPLSVEDFRIFPVFSLGKRGEGAASAVLETPLKIWFF